MKVYSLKTNQFVKSSIPEVFDFFSRPENLEKLTPRRLRFNIITPHPIEMKSGLLIDYTIKILFIPVHWRTLITMYKPPFKFVDEQIKGPYKFWHHTHIFNEVKGGVEIIDSIKYSIPYGLFGRLFHFLWIKKELVSIFKYRRDIIAQNF